MPTREYATPFLKRYSVLLKSSNNEFRTLFWDDIFYLKTYWFSPSIDPTIMKIESRFLFSCCIIVSSQLIIFVQDNQSFNLYDVGAPSSVSFLNGLGGFPTKKGALSSIFLGTLCFLNKNCVPRTSLYLHWTLLLYSTWSSGFHSQQHRLAFSHTFSTNVKSPDQLKLAIGRSSVFPRLPKLASNPWNSQGYATEAYSDC